MVSYLHEPIQSWVIINKSSSSNFVGNVCMEYDFPQLILVIFLADS